MKALLFAANNLAAARYATAATVTAGLDAGGQSPAGTARDWAKAGTASGDFSSGNTALG